MKPKKSPGGRREVAGRPSGTGKYKEETKSVRIPVSLLPKVQKMLSEFEKKKTG